MIMDDSTPNTSEYPSRNPSGFFGPDGYASDHKPVFSLNPADRGNHLALELMKGHNPQLRPGASPPYSCDFTLDTAAALVAKC